MLSATSPPPEADARILDQFPGFLGIARSPDGSEWIQVSTLTTGPGYDAKRFYDAYTSSVKLFDPLFFSQSIGELLFSTAVTFFLINVVSAARSRCRFPPGRAAHAGVHVAFVLCDVATLGTLNLMGRPLDIPGLMLSIIVFGLGIDFSIFFVRSFQRYGTLNHPAFSQIRMAVFLSAVTTLFGFGAMWEADHSLLHSTGITAFLGIAYSMIGAFFILPTLLGRIRRNRDKPRRPGRQPAGPGVGALPATWRPTRGSSRASRCAWTRCSANWREMLHSADGVKAILDIGTGYGVPASWLLERFAEARVRGVEPSAERVQIAAMALGERGCVTQGRAPEIPEVERRSTCAR